MVLQYSSVFHKLGFLTLTVLALIRPLLSTLDNFGIGLIGHLSVLFFSYLLIFLICLVFKDFLRKIDTTGVLIICFCFLVCLSTLWDADFENLIRNTIPFAVYFAARTFLDSPKKVMFVVLAFIIGYILPIFGSFLAVITGISSPHIEYYSQVERHSGLYSNVHKAAHSMGIFSILYGFFLCQKDRHLKPFNIGIFFIFCVSIYVVWNTYVRSAYVGIFIFWFVFLFFYNKKIFKFLLFSCIPLMLIKKDSIFNIFFKTKTTEIDLFGASSGRTYIWKHNLKLFLGRPFYQKFLGSGLASETAHAIGGYDEIWSSHNDWISLLMTVGLVGVIVYAGVLLSFTIKVLKSHSNIKIKGFFIGSVLLFLSTTMLTNYFGRLEVSQSFWLILGCFYAFEKQNDNRLAPKNYADLNSS